MEDQNGKKEHPIEIVGERVVCRDGPSGRLPEEVLILVSLDISKACDITFRPHMLHKLPTTINVQCIYL